MRRLRKWRSATYVAFVALVLEIFFGAIHAAALAATALGTPAGSNSFIGQICTPDGLKTITLGGEGQGSPNKSGSRGAASDYCPVCHASATSPLALPSGVAVLPPLSLVMADGWPRQDVFAGPTSWQNALIRAPPLL